MKSWAWFRMTVLMAMCLVVCSCCRHENDATDAVSTNVLECAMRIESFHDLIVSNGAVISEIEYIGKLIMANETNRAVRLELVRRLKDVVSNVDLTVLPERVKFNLEYGYWHVPVEIAAGLLFNGATEDEAGDVIINAMRKYTAMCFSFGKEEDVLDGDGRSARERRINARMFRKAWEKEMLFFEWTMIDAVFGSISKEASKRFLDRWHGEFGCHLKSHPEYKALNPEE